MIEQKEVEGIFHKGFEESIDDDVESQIQESKNSVVEEKIENSTEINIENADDAPSTNDFDLVNYIQNSEPFASYLKDLHSYRNKLCFLLTLPGFSVMIASAADPSLVLPFWFVTMGIEGFYSLVAFSHGSRMLRNDPPLYPVSKEVDPMRQVSEATIMGYEQANLEYKRLLLVKFLLVPALYVMSCVINPEDVLTIAFLAICNYLVDLWCMDVKYISYFLCVAERVLKVGTPKTPEDYPKFLTDQAKLAYPELDWERNVTRTCAEWCICNQVPCPKPFDPDYRETVRDGWRKHNDSYFGREFWAKLTKTYGLRVIELPKKNGDVENQQETKSSLSSFDIENQEESKSPSV
ncbi:MAG: hypothetical protein ACE365_08410 [Gammaproteobacteria bacterium]